MLVADLRLLDLLTEGKQGNKVAGHAARVQTLAATRYQHILNMTEERTWAALRRAAFTGRMRDVRVHCSRCGAVALLTEWAVMLWGSEDMRRRLWGLSNEDNRTRLRKCATGCNGDVNAAGLLHLTESRD